MFSHADAFLLVVFVGIVVMLISLALDVLWAQVIPITFFNYFIRAPGVIIHEGAHILGCLITGAKIKKVVLFSKWGGFVTYSPPVLPYLGDVIISTAPLFCIPLVLAGCTWVFGTYLGCSFPSLSLSVDSADAIQGMGAAIIGVFTRNLFTHFNAWFLLYLYLTISLVLSLAPSIQDIKNAAIGIVIIAVTGVLIFWSDIAFVVNLLWVATRIMGMGFTLALGFEMIAMVISLPFMAWYLLRRT